MVQEYVGTSHSFHHVLDAVDDSVQGGATKVIEQLDVLVLE